MRALISGLLLIVLLAPGARGQSVPPEARAAYDKAELAREEGRLAEAAKLYQEAIAAHPLYERAHAGHLAALRGLDDIVAALTLYDGLVESHPDSVELKAFRAALQGGEEAEKALEALAKEHGDNLRVCLELARARLTIGDLRGAEKAAKSAVKIDGTSTLARVLLGDVQMGKRKWVSARKEYEAALEGDPDLASGRLRLGLCLHRAGKTDDGLKVLERLVSEDGYPRLVAGHWMLALVQAELGKYTEAIASLDRVLAINKDDYEALIARGHVLLMDARPSEAAKAFGKAVEARPTDPQPLFCLGWALEQAADAPEIKDAEMTERLTAAAEAYEKCAGLDPGVRPRDSLGFVFLLGERHYEAEIQFKRARDVDPEFAPVHNNLGLARDIADDRTAAKKSYERVLQKIDKKNVRAHVMLALDTWLDGSHAKAIKLLEKALRIAPDDDLAWTFLGDIHYDMNRQDRAIKAYREATEINDKNFIAWYHMGIAYQDKRKFEDADRCFRKALEAKPVPPADLALRMGSVNDEGGLERLEEALKFYQLYIELGGTTDWVPDRIEALKDLLATE